MVSGCSLINPNCGIDSVPSDTVYFDYDSSVLKHDAQVTLSQQLEILTEDDSPIVIEGHADERGTREYNIGLGARRANDVRNYLLSKGIEYERMTQKGDAELIRKMTPLQKQMLQNLANGKYNSLSTLKTVRD